MLGADSTSTYPSLSGPHYYNHAQKLFEIGEDSTVGIVTWGLGGKWSVCRRNRAASGFRKRSESCGWVRVFRRFASQPM